MCEQLATYVAVRGGRTLIGHSYEEGALSLPYLAFIEAMRTYVLERDPEQLKQDLGSGAGEIARLVSEVRERVGVEPAAVGPDPDEERWRLYQAVVGFLRTAGAVQPLAIVLEDLHWADRGTLDLLLHLSRQLAGARLLVVVTYRDVEIDRAYPLAGALADLRRSAGFARVSLRGLHTPEVQRLLAGIAGVDVPPSLGEVVFRQTEGNPLFVQEVARYLVEEGLLSGVRSANGRSLDATAIAMSLPEGLREVIGKRLSRLSAECNRVLAVGAVIGREFALDTLRPVSRQTEEALVAALEEATRVAVLEEEARLGRVRYRFSHAFFRQTLYEEMSAPRRIQLHQQVALALEQQYAGRLEEHAAELAEHFSHSSDRSDLAKAVAYGERAALRATAVNAYGEAVHHLEQALEVQEVLDPDDRTKRCDLLLALGDALGPAGESLRAAEDVAPEAFAVAEALNDHRRAFRASLLATMTLRRYGSFTIFGTPAFREWAERADRYAEPETVERVWADICVAQVHRGSEERATSWEINWRAVELARKLDDARALYAAADLLLAAGMFTGHEDDQLQVAQDVAQRPRTGVGPPTLDRFLMNAGAIFMESGDRSRAEELWRELDELAGHSHDPSVLIHSLRVQAWRATIDGELDAALEIAQQLLTTAEESGAAEAGRNFTAHIVYRPLAWLGRDTGSLTDGAETTLLGYGNLLAASVIRAVESAKSGHRSDAHTALREALGRLPRTGLILSSAALLLELGVVAEDRATVATLMQRVDRAPPLSFGSGGLTCVARSQGAAAAFLGNGREARVHYERALDACERIRYRPEVAQIRLGLAELLLDGKPEQRDEALRHLDFAIGEFRAMKMQPALEQALAHRGLLKA